VLQRRGKGAIIRSGVRFAKVAERSCTNPLVDIYSQLAMITLPR
jgi:hypothetical protein